MGAGAVGGDVDDCVYVKFGAEFPGATGREPGVQDWCRVDSGRVWIALLYHQDTRTRFSAFKPEILMLAPFHRQGADILASPDRPMRRTTALCRRPHQHLRSRSRHIRPPTFDPTRPLARSPAALLPYDPPHGPANRYETTTHLQIPPSRLPPPLPLPLPPPRPFLKLSQPSQLFPQPAHFFIPIPQSVGE